MTASAYPKHPKGAASVPPDNSCLHPIRLERDRFAEACRAFRPWLIDFLRDPEVERRDRALWATLGAPADGTLAEIADWFDAQPGDAGDAAIEGAVDLLMERPDDQAAIRAALARAAPHLGHDARNPPLTILAALRAAVTA